MNIDRRSAIRLLAAGAATSTFARDSVEVRFTSVSPRTVRISIANRGAEVPNPGFLLPEVASRKPDHVRAPGSQRLTLGGLTVMVGETPLTVQVRRRGARSAPRLSLDLQSGVLSFLTSDGPVFGLGEGGPKFDRRGVLYTMQNGQIGKDQRTYGARVPVPLILGARGWALFVHQPEGRFDLTDIRTGKFLPPSPPSVKPLDLFVTVDDDPAVLLREYAGLTGLPELPPLWAFGYQQSHRTLASLNEILGIARTFREKNLPCDVLIYLGTGFTPSGWNTGHESFTFNRKVFPEPAAIIEELHRQHFRVVLHAVYRKPALSGSAADSCATPGAAQEAGCYWQMHRDVFKTGIDGWWPDEGDNLDAASRLARNRLYHEGPLLERPNERPYALHRNGAPGSQRFGAFLWSGDVSSTWETLRLHLPVAVNTGLSGFPFWGTDTGGFVPTKELTGELYARWFQFSAFCPLFRSHGRTWKLRLPWQWNTGDMGPSEASLKDAADPDPSELHNPEVEPICRRYLELRYRLMPYLYSAVRESHETGLPIMRALWLHHPDDPDAVARGTEYLWGRDILVAPVVERGAAKRHLYLPRGQWFDFWNESPVEGGRQVSRPVDLATIPLYVRAGAILPFGPLKEYTAEPVAGPLELVVYPGADGRFTLYEDDGVTYDFKRGEFSRLRLEWVDRSHTLSIRPDGGRSVRPRELSVRIAPGTEARTVSFRGSPLQLDFLT